MNNSSALLVLAVGLAIFLTMALLHFWSKLNWVDAQMPPVKVLGVTLPLLTWIKYKRRPTIKPDWVQLKANGLILIEISLIIGWALWIGRRYLNFDPDMWPAGGEFVMGIQSHYGWRLLGECGGCFFWNGFSNGGAPAFVDLHSAWLHPVVALATLVWGEINGAKVILIAAFIMAGIAQWYLAKVLHLGAIPRLWSACIAVAGGNLAGRMENGSVPLIVSTAACSLVIPFAVDLVWNKRRRAAIGLGVTAGLAFLAGQGYLQLGMLFSLIPAIIILQDNNQEKRISLRRYFLWAGVLAILLAAILWIPYIHFLPNWVKYGNTYLEGATPLAYGPLTLVMDDLRFYIPDIFQGGTYLQVNYIGWVPVILALTSLFLAPQRLRRLQIFFILAIILTYLASAAVPFRLLMKIWPLAGTSVRNPAPIAGLAVPFVLGLAAWGLDCILSLNWPSLVLVQREILKVKYIFEAKTSWLLWLLLLWSMSSVANFSIQWMYLLKVTPSDRIVMQHLVTPTAEWAQPPWGEYQWFVFAREVNVKMAEMYRPWFWKDREIPASYIEGTHDAIDPASPGFLASENGINIVIHPENEYASVETTTDHIPCQAQARGGNIDVVCQTSVEGELVVQENSWSGWFAKQDGNSVKLLAGNWLRVKAPAGSHRYTFRYRPWDVPLGIALSLLGVALAIVLWFRWSPPTSDILMTNADLT